MHGEAALGRVIEMGPKTCLDIGSGKGAQAAAMRAAGIGVTTCDAKHDADYVGQFPECMPKHPNIPDFAAFDCVWSCHCLEHSRNPGAFLDAMTEWAKPQTGIIAVTVPPAKAERVGGHLSLWTPGLLVYNMVRAGLDCSDAWVAGYGYNISVVTRNIRHGFPVSQYLHDRGEIDLLSEFFPWHVQEGCLIVDKNTSKLAQNCENDANVKEM